MKIFVISLKSAEQRRALVVEQFARTALNFEFFDAVEGNDAALSRFDEYDRRAYRLSTGREPLPGEIACFASHLELWRAAVAANEPIVVLEDDCHLEQSFESAVGATSRLIHKYGFIRLQSSLRYRWIRFGRIAQPVYSADNFQLYYLSRVPLCSTGYVISPESAARLLAASRILIAPVDKFFQQTCLHRTPVFGLEPASVSLSPLAGHSSIGERIVHDRSPVESVQRTIWKLKVAVLRHNFNRAQLRLIRNSVFHMGRIDARLPSAHH